ncbi:MAG: hypothetical protein MUP60_04915, partial [Candidatus Thorarchaeota archaeon]|nr:hypothetical protein [Candidatus Thorarchaeota archaeon]
MKNKKLSSWRLVRFELESSYQFPTIPIIFCIFIGIGLFSTFSIINYSVDAYIRSTPEWNNAQWVDYISNLVSIRTLTVFVAGVQNCTFVFIALVPLLISSNFAQDQ